MGSYYEEFLKPRISAKGVHDVFLLGILPELKGVYRPDAYLPGEKAAGPELKVDAVFVSHAHADHVGHLGFLAKEIPVICSPVTAAVIKATQDSSQPSLEGENVIFAERGQNAKTVEPLLAKINSYEYRWRSYFNAFNEPVSARFEAYWTANLVSPRNMSMRSSLYEPKSFKECPGRIGDIDFKAFPVDHSVYGATAYVFELGGPGGKKVAYSGDLRLHGLYGETTKAFKERLADIKPDYLVVEGTNVGSSKGNDLGKAQRASEADVEELCLKAVAEQAGRLVIADFGPRNIERLVIFLRIAEKTKRKLAVTTKDLLFLQAMATADAVISGAVRNESLYVYTPVRATTKAWETPVLCAHQKRIVTADDVKAHPGDFIMAFSFWDLNNLLDIAPREGAYIYSTCEAFNEEMIVDAQRLINWMERFKLTPYGIGWKHETETGRRLIEYTRGYHASGHISETELKDFIHEVRPGAVIPIHTEHPEIFDELIPEGTRLILPEQGVPISLS